MKDQELVGLPGHSEAVSGVVGGEASAFTPGPWVPRRAVKPDNVGGYDWAIIAPERAIIAEAFEIVGADDTRPVEANARLIAAAPDLLEALSALLTACEEDCGIPSDRDADDEAVGAGEGGDMALTFGMLRRARVALEKALGPSARDTTEPQDSPGIDHEDPTP